jgi:hypothetical protein
MSLEIADALSRLNLPIFDQKSAAEFLGRIDIQKDPTDRLFSWLIALGLPTDIAQIHHDYQQLIAKPEELHQADRRLIDIDVPRSVPWILSLARQLSLDISGPLTTDHSCRVLSALVFPSTSRCYIQGFDRYQMLMYLLGLLFTTKSGLSPEVAESLSFRLTLAVLDFACMPRLLEDGATTQIQFQKNDKYLKTQVPEIYRRLPERVGSFHFSLKWRLVLFADQHTAAEVFLIWDSIFLRKEILDEFFVCLTSAHLKQIRLSGEKSTVEQIQNWDQWNCEELVTDAVKSLDEKRSVMRFFPHWSTRYWLGGVAIFLIAVFIALLFHR